MDRIEPATWGGLGTGCSCSNALGTHDRDLAKREMAKIVAGIETAPSSGLEPHAVI